MTTMVRDTTNAPIEALSPLESLTAIISNTSPIITGTPYLVGHIIRVTATVPCYIAFGGATATNMSTYLPAGTVEYFTIKTSGTSLSVLAAVDPGTINVSRMY